MTPGHRRTWIALAAVASLAGCQRCSAPSGAGSSGTAPAASVEAPAAPDASPPATAGEDVPEIRDTGPGRATAALRAALTAEGIPFDAATIERECKVDDDGASIDDLEDVAVKDGLDAAQILVPVEHLLLAAPRMLPAIAVVGGADDAQDFVLLFRLDGDRVQIMSPVEGRQWVSRADLAKSLYVHETTMPADEVRAAMSAPPFRDALLARMAALGAPGPAAQALLDRAAADPGFRGLAALDAAIRQIEGAPGQPGGDMGAKLGAAFGCAFEARCEGVAPVPPALFWARPGAEGEAQVRGVLLLAIAGKKPLAGDAGGG